eukprot:TRINITY_DN6458_c0_g1_i2.p1 TRINITY_DN6458_c0_g1~~TRINITY_DN6458_c0_g1_i2.p1  ORF type:complete len:191 (+),score=24.17 TRINITY_DN6458_c0_g1_i2:65-637(+)
MCIRDSCIALCFWPLIFVAGFVNPGLQQKPSPTRAPSHIDKIPPSSLVFEAHGDGLTITIITDRGVLNTTFTAPVSVKKDKENNVRFSFTVPSEDETPDYIAFALECNYPADLIKVQREKEEVEMVFSVPQLKRARLNPVGLTSRDSSFTWRLRSGPLKFMQIVLNQPNIRVPSLLKQTRHIYGVLATEL